MTRAILWTIPFILFSLASAPAAWAQDGLMPPQAADEVSAAEYQLSPEEDTHPLIRLTPDKSDIVRLDSEARSIIVGNPANLSVLMDNTKTLILVPQVPGATHFTVLDKNGKVIMQRHVIVASPKEQYLRVRRSCAMAAGNVCEQTSVYYCPDGDMCQPVAVPTSTTASTGGNLLGAALSGGGSSGSSGQGLQMPNIGSMMQQLQNSFSQGVAPSVTPSVTTGVPQVPATGGTDSGGEKKQ